MPEITLCKICGKRRAKRPCPVVDGEICTYCCGTEREVSLSCPLECEYLQQAHRHEKAVSISEKDIANQDIAVTEEFMQSHEELLLFCIYSLLTAALRTPGAVDSDVVSALAASIQTHRTLESGLVYETRAENSIAASVQTSFAASLEDYQKLRVERERLSPVRNAEIIAVLVFLHRVGQQSQNGRPRGRMFLDLLRHMVAERGAESRESRIIL